MAAVKDFFKEKQSHYFKFAALILLFLLLAFDQNLSMTYMLIMIADFIWFNTDRKIELPLRTGRNKGYMWLIESAAALGLFLITSTVLVGLFEPQAIGAGFVGGAQSIFQLLATSTPILQGSAFLTLLAWGILVPIIETSFFNGRLLEGLTTYAENFLGIKISLNKYSAPLLIVIFIVATIFTLFHITAKGIDSLPLIITFVFSVISSILVLRHRETAGAILLHIATNSMAVSSALGWL